MTPNKKDQSGAILKTLSVIVGLGVCFASIAMTVGATQRDIETNSEIIKHHTKELDNIKESLPHNLNERLRSIEQSLIRIETKLEITKRLISHLFHSS